MGDVSSCNTIITNFSSPLDGKSQDKI
uniref:Uncharacterized protein n=1 Tax=Rhizophora mucronata TaxID=61149 RepID=A0A2P2MDF8_RHIMU